MDDADKLNRHADLEYQAGNYQAALELHRKAAALSQQQPTPQPSYTDQALAGLQNYAKQKVSDLGNIAAGGLKEASNIGATILSPLDYAARKLNNGQPLEIGGYDILGQDRRSDVSDVLKYAGADENSLAFKSGKLATGIAGTAGMGGLLGKGLLAVAPNAAPIASAIESGGFNTGGLTGLQGLGTRLLGGATTGGASAGLVNPDEAKTGALIGGGIPLAGYVPEGLKSGARDLMWRALKPIQKVQRTGEADKAIETLLKYGINPTSGGVDKMRGMIYGLNDDIASRIANSDVKLNQQEIANSIDDVNNTFLHQANPLPDLAKIEDVKQGFLNHPLIQNNEIPVQLAQALKQGTYKVLKGKFGESGSATTEAEKALARGLKEHIANNVPEVGGLNALESELINAKNISERRAMMANNNNIIGISGLAHNPAAWAAMMLDKSALVKSLLARASNSMGKSAEAIGDILPQPIASTGIVLAGANKPELTDQQKLALALMTDQQKQDYLNKIGAK